MPADVFPGTKTEYVAAVKVAIERYPAPADVLQFSQVHPGMQIDFKIAVNLAAEQEIINDRPQIAVTGINRVPVCRMNAAGEFADFRNNEFSISRRRDQRPCPGKISANADLIDAEGN